MTSVAVDSGWMGTYSPVALSQVLKRVADEGRSGDLQIVSGNQIKTIRIDKGAVRFAASNLREDRLGESMLSHDFISQNDYQLASKRMMDDRCRFGEALLKLGRLDRKQLHRELGVQVQRIVLSLFRVPEGLYSFEEADSAVPRLPFSLSVPPLLLKGLRRVSDGRIILEALPPADTIVRMAESPPSGIELRKLAAIERTMLERAGGGASIGAIVRDPSLERSQAIRSCYALLTVGLLELAPLIPETESDDESARELIDSQFERLEEVAEEDLLGVRKDASAGELRETYEGLRGEWDEMRAQTKDPALLEKIDAIDFRLAAAFHQLLVERARTEDPPIAAGPGELAELVEPEAPGEPVEPDVSAEPLENDPARQSRMEQLDRDAKLHFQVKDWTGAVSLLHELVSLAPKSASYQMMLGQAMQHNPQLVKDAEQHFLQAVELAPGDAAVHVALARYYRRTKKHARAVGSLERALEIDPRNEEALRLLEAGQKPTRMKRLLGKIFQ